MSASGPSGPLVFRIIMSAAYPILFEQGIPNLWCGCILELQSVMYQQGWGSPEFRPHSQCQKSKFFPQFQTKNFQFEQIFFVYFLHLFFINTNTEHYYTKK